MYESIEEFLKINALENLVTYDITNEDPSADVRNEADPIRKFQKFKTSDSNFDPDSSNGSCSLTNSLYEKLWEWSWSNRYSMPEYLINKLGTSWGRVGADTMNSFQTSYSQALKIYSGDYHSVNNNGYIKKFAALTHSIGNFTLVPFKLDPKNDVKSFNQYRGYRFGKYFVYDYFDLSLKLIKDNVSDSLFKAYIDTFFLNDYVDNQYNIKPLFKEHKRYLSESKLSLENPDKFLPANEVELNEYLENVLTNIMLRGNRIIAALKREYSSFSTIRVESHNNTAQYKIKSNRFLRFIAILMNKLKTIIFTFLGITVGILSFSLVMIFINKSNYQTVQLVFLCIIFLPIIFICLFIFLKIRKWIGFDWCFNCKKFGRFLHNKTCTGTKEIFIKKKLETKDNYGKVTSTREQYILGTRKFFNNLYRCKYCDYEETIYVTKDFDNV